jgi:2-iminobutanoate/2-iminopropanoate deaminase
LPTRSGQTRQVLSNIVAIVRAAGSDPTRILRCTVYVDDVAGWPEVNQAYEAFFAQFGVGIEHPMPARTIVPTGPLHYGYQVEIDAIAAI